MNYCTYPNHPKILEEEMEEEEMEEEEEAHLYITLHVCSCLIKAYKQI